MLEIPDETISCTSSDRLAASKSFHTLGNELKNIHIPMLPSKYSSIAFPLGAIAMLSLASCSLPSDQAWRQIRQDGLISYLATDGETAPNKVKTAPAIVANKKPTIHLSNHSGSKPANKTAPVVNTPPPSELASASLPTAQSVPGLDGYVRSPFTNPPRLVDIRGMSTGSKVVCPYTRRPFLVPAGVSGASNTAIAATTPAPAPAAPTVAAAPTAPAPAPAPKMEAPQAPTKVAANNVTAPQPPPAPVAPKLQPNTGAPAPQKANNEMPFGNSIPGRPGFVNSPYAAKHQLVDVTGLPTGMEVKCPYTGKLFRVPAGANGN
jgi:hypothetical protein